MSCVFRRRQGFHQIPHSSWPLAIVPQVAVLLLWCPAHADPSGASEIDRLIQQLGSQKLAEREAASKRLDVIGEPALDALKKMVAAPLIPLEYKRLVRQLASPKFSEREAAHKRLLTDGEPALDALKQAAT